MTERDITPVRTEQRYSHVYIGLMVKRGDEWRGINATDWNESGFNFFIDQELQDDTVQFKKGAKQFTGKVMWKLKGNNGENIFERILNTLLFGQLNKLGNNKETMRRVVNLIRAQGRIEEKMKLLSTLDPDKKFTGDIEALLERNKEEVPVYRYGVFIDDDAWRGIVRYALETSLVVLTMEKIKEGLSGRQTF